MRNHLLPIALGSLFIFSTGHLKAGQEQVLEATDQESLLENAEEWERQFEEQKREALNLAEERGWPVRYEDDAGTVYELMKVNDLGMPIYNQTNNVDAAETSGTDELHSGGSLGLSLSGDGLIIGEWDGGEVRTSHDEFTGRATQMDNPSSLSSHATHVAGTLIGAGVDPDAKGMSYEGDLNAYDWNNDNADMASEAASGLLLSNHSYGEIAGWQDRDTAWHWYGYHDHFEDYKFGLYDSDASKWDEIASDAPYYLIVKSAGNNRNSNGPSSGTYYRYDSNWDWVQDTDPRAPNDSFNTIPPRGNAKNIMTVGAIEEVNGQYTQPSDVNISSFSSWGPTDDGRIKPDLVAEGVNLKSAESSSDGAYAIRAGTSMSAPVVTGSLMLLQEYYHDLNGEYMFSSTLRALAIHTAHETGGGPAPDYKFGWGLLNSEGAAQAIKQDGDEFEFTEDTLNDQQTFSIQANATGEEPLKVTLCWTDPEANETLGDFDDRLNDTTSKLIHDLDLRVSSDNQTWKPFILDPQNPDQPATTGDNDRDNVEQVLIQDPDPGQYTITIDHKGTLTEPQAFSVIASGITTQPIVTHQPDRENYCAGDSISVAYSANEPFQSSNTFSAKLFSESLGDTLIIGTKQDSSDGEISAYISDTLPEGDDYYIRVDGSDPQTQGARINKPIQIRGLNEVPLYEDFKPLDFPPDSWLIEAEETTYSWSRTNSVSAYSTDSASIFLNNFDYNAPGTKDQIYTPLLDFTDDPYVSFSFDYAYSYYGDPDYADTLAVEYSTDCGQSWNQLFRKGGDSLATATSQTSLFVPSPSQWESKSFPVYHLNGEQQVMFRFTNINQNGNVLFLDNIAALPAEVTTGSIAEEEFCPGESFSIPYSSRGQYQPDNYFIAELSSKDGSFEDPYVLDSIQSQSDGTFQVSIPDEIQDGDGYRVRVNSTNPDITGEENESDLKIHSTPEPQLSLDKGAEICDGQELTIATPHDDDLDYQWFRDEIPLTGETDNEIEVDRSGDFMVEVTNPEGCTGANDTTVEVYPLPNAEIIRPSDTSLCEGEEVTLEAYNDQYQFEWFKNGEELEGETSSELTVGEGGSYVVEATNDDECSSESDPVEITVDPLPPAEVVANDTTTLCEGDSVKLMPDFDAGGYTIEWLFEGNLIENGETEEYIAGREGAYSFHITDDQTQCENRSGTIEVTTLENPEVSLAGEPETEACENDTISLSVNTQEGNVLTWYRNDQVVAESDTFLSVTEGGQYHVEAENENRCTDLTSNLEVEFHPMPEQPEIEREGDTLISSADEGNQWYFQGEIMENETGKYLFAEDTGEYQVKVASEQGCSRISEPFELTSLVTSLTGDALFRGDIDVYPNPSQGEFSIVFEAPLFGSDLSLKVVDLTGRKVYESSHSPGENDRKYSLDLRSLSAGVYHLSIIGENQGPEAYRYKLIIEE